MDARDSDSVNLSDEKSVEIIMGIEWDLEGESIDNTNTSLAKKKARAINLGKWKYTLKKNVFLCFGCDNMVCIYLFSIMFFIWLFIGIKYIFLNG